MGEQNDTHDGTGASCAFDGIICMGGEDWWYHNRGHFDFQILRRIGRDVPVLYVNSIGVRFPSVGNPAQFAGRIKRKLASLSRGLVRVENNFAVFSPFMVPGSVGQAVSGWGLGPQVQIAVERMGIKRPLMWIHCPAGVRILDRFPSAPVVMQRTDRFEAFPEAAGANVARDIAELQERADLAIYCNGELMAEERDIMHDQVLVTHGVDYDRFASAGTSPVDPLELAADDFAAIVEAGRPIAGFIGGIDHHTFDAKLFCEVAGQLPDVSFMMVGGCSLEEGWCPHENVYLLGRKPYDEIADYMAQADVLLMPWNQSSWIQACNPIKLKEYLAVGRPVVTTDFPALDGVRDLVRVANDARGFAEAIVSALADGVDVSASRSRVEREGWDAKADQVMQALIAIATRSKSRSA